MKWRVAELVPGSVQQDQFGVRTAAQDARHGGGIEKGAAHRWRGSGHRRGGSVSQRPMVGATETPRSAAPNLHPPPTARLAVRY
jgi:hypothetical protein